MEPPLVSSVDRQEVTQREGAKGNLKERQLSAVCRDYPELKAISARFLSRQI
jgi:hypothetical protein